MEEQPKPPTPSGSSDVEENKIIAVLGYFGILFLIPLLAKPNSPFAKYHGKQGMVLFISGIIVGFVAWIPFIGWLFGAVAGIFLFVCFIMGIINAAGGQMKPLPLIGEYADKIKI